MFDSIRSMKAGEVHMIVGIDASLAAAKRLADMGFVSGAAVEMVRPGDPCLVRIGGTCVGLGEANQKCILISRPSLPGCREAGVPMKGVLPAAR